MTVPEDTSAVDIDRRARGEALEVTRSLLLQAPAGSGKTTVLTARFLALLAAVDAPEEILAITFTRKAAAEMRHRILAALQAGEAHQQVPGIEPTLLQRAAHHNRARGWGLLDNPARLRIQTIDAFHHALATALPIAAGAGTQLRIASAPDSLYRRAARRTLGEALHSRELGKAAELLFGRLDNSWRRLEQLLAQMLARRTHWLSRVLEARAEGMVARIEDSLAAMLRAELARVVGVLPAQLLREAEALLAQLEPGAAHTLLAEPVSLPAWRRACALALTQTDSFRRQFTVREGFARDAQALKQRAAAWVAALEASAGAHAALCALRALPEPQLPHEDHVALAALGQLLLQAAAELQWVFAEQGKVDHAFVAAAAGAALRDQGGPSDVALRTGAGLRHVLVDEFQDTSYEQLQLLRALTAGWEQGDGRTLFLVGDPMQSIYQFREAEVGLFLQARTHGIGEQRLESLELRRNFRSNAGLIDWVNRHFAQLFPPADDARRAAVRYLPAVAANVATAIDGTGPDGVGLHRLDAADPQAEAARVLDIVRDARARDADCSIAVLVASREHASAIVASLRAADMAPRGVDLERLGERPLVRDLAALTRALLHAADRSAWLALLRAPWCGLTLAQLEAWVAIEPVDWFETLDASAGEAWAAMDEAARMRIRRLCRALTPALQGRERNRPLWERVERCWLRLGGTAVYPATVDRLDARRFVDALAAYDEPETLVGEAVDEITARLYSSAPPQRGAIDILTMHAAKGLEWDVVILPGLGRRTASDREPLLHWIELPRAGGGSDLLLAPVRAVGAGGEDRLAAYIKRLRGERLRLERVRLLYVAATRARRALHLLGSVASDGDAEAAPARNSLLAMLWPAIGAEFLRTQPMTATPEPVVLPSAMSLCRLPLDWTPRAGAHPQATRLQLAAAVAAETPEYSWVGQSARAIGTVVHAELQRLAGAALPALADAVTATTLEPAPGTYALWLTELGVPESELPEARQRILEALQRTLRDPRGRWLLSREHAMAHSEWRLTGRYAGRVHNVIFDRMLIDAQGQRWIVDFKSSTHEGGAIEQFLEHEVQRYRPQLQRYAALAAQLGPEPVRVALYFPLLGVFREVPLQ